MKNILLMQCRGIAALIMGAPGSGKGTISTKILADFPFKHISTGDLLRENVMAGTELGKAAKTYMDRGAYVPDELIIGLLEATLRETALGTHLLLDGFPRSLPQAEALETRLPIDLALEIDVPRATIVDRLSDRWLHPSSGRIYAYAYKPPKRRGFDDATGEPLVRREDDDPAVVEQRLEKYAEATAPLLEYYRKRNLLNAFQGTRSDEIYVNVKIFLTDFLAAHGGGGSGGAGKA